MNSSSAGSCRTTGLLAQKCTFGGCCLQQKGVARHDTVPVKPCLLGLDPHAVPHLPHSALAASNMYSKALCEACNPLFCLDLELHLKPHLPHSAEWKNVTPVLSVCRTLNRIQSRIYPTALNSNQNLLVCAPTGAGKTNIAMLAVLHEVGQNMRHGVIQKQDFKVVYVAPMKALAAEVTAAFSKRLGPLGKHLLYPELLNLPVSSVSMQREACHGKALQSRLMQSTYLLHHVLKTLCGSTKYVHQYSWSICRHVCVTYTNCINQSL